MQNDKQLTFLSSVHTTGYNLLRCQCKYERGRQTYPIKYLFKGDQRISDENTYYLSGLRVCTEFPFDVFNVKKMNIETQCDVNVTENFNIKFDSMFLMIQC